jgi:Putative auto-transporter adhesin, head GIN domain
MKKSLFVIASLLFLGSYSSIAQDKDKNDDWDKNKIEGSGHLITKDVPVQSFDALSTSGVFYVVLTQGSKEAVKIEADDNLMDLFEVKNEGSKLVVGMKKKSNYSSKNRMKVYITFRNLKHMDLKMVGNLSSDNNLNFENLSIENNSVGSVSLNMTAQTLNVDNKSVGNVKFNGKAESAMIKNTGVGSLEASDFVVQKMNIENTGVGSAHVNAEKELIIKDSFLGKVKNKGAATVKRLNKSSI